MFVECSLCTVLRFCLLFIVTGLISVYLYLKYSYGYWKRKRVEYVEPTIPFGNFSLLFDGKSHLQDCFLKIYNAIKGPFGGFYIFGSPALMIKDPALIKQLLVKDFNYFPDRGIHSDPQDPLSGHLFRLTGQKWKNLRIKLRPTFTSGKLKMMFPFLIQQGDHYISFLKNCVEKKEKIDARDSCIKYTLDVINSVAFGIETNSFENPNNELRLFIQQFFDRNCSYLQGAVNYLAIITPDIFKYLPIKLFNETITNFMLTLLRRIINYREANKVTRNDFLQLLIQLKNKGEVAKEDDAGDKSVYDGDCVQGLTFEELAAQAFVFLFAGFDTSATTMTFTLFELAKAPHIQEKVRKEIKHVLARHDGKFSYEAVYEMEFLGMVISETLRKYPPLGFLPRISVEDYQIPDSDVVLKKGTRLFISLLGLHYDPKYFPDPDKYDPERFNNENKENILPYTYLPFGEGPRICIGMQMGKMQSRVGLAMILNQYEFSNCEDTPTTVRAKYGQLLLSPDQAIKLSVQEVK